MEITMSMINKWVVRSLAINKLEKRQKALKEEILKLLQSGAKFSLEGDFIIQLSANGGKDLSWEAEYEKLLTRVYARKSTKTVAAARAKATMEKMKQEAPDKKGVEIDGVNYPGGVKFNIRPNEQKLVASVTKVA